MTTRFAGSLLVVIFAGVALHGQQRSSVAAMHSLRGAEGRSDLGGKCGTGFLLAAVTEGKLTATATGVIAAVRPAKQVSVLSPSGHFRVHFDTTGIEVPALLDQNGLRVAGTAASFVDSVCAAFDRAWSKEVDSMGYLAPPPDNGGGGGDEYDIYLVQEPGGVFGETAFEDPPYDPGPPQRYRSWVLLDCDFEGLRTPGIAGLRVTAAHEFFHAIQIGRYGVWSTADFYFYEMTSVWMEEQVFPDVNDYLFDAPRFFGSFGTRSLAVYDLTYAGYERSVLPIFLGLRFGSPLLRRTWELLASKPPLYALEAALEERGSAIAGVLREFAQWDYYTADRAKPGQYFPESALLPRWSPQATATAGAGSAFASYPFAPFSLGHLAFAVGGDTLTAVVVNTDIVSAPGGGSSSTTASVTLSRSSTGGPEQQLSGGWYAGFRAAPAGEWDVNYLSRASLSDVQRERPSAGPNPWRLREDRELFLPVPVVASERVEVSFVNPGADVVYRGAFVAESDRGTVGVRIPSSAVSSVTATGVYAIVIHAGGKDHLRKIAIIR